MSWMENRFEKNFMLTTVDYVFNWARKSAIWPMTFGLACCAIEMIASSTVALRHCALRLGSVSPQPAPERPDDRRRHRHARRWRRCVEAHLRPDARPEVGDLDGRLLVGWRTVQYVAVLQGVDKIVPVDVYVIGCPPRPENLFYALLKLQDKIDTMTHRQAPDRSAPGTKHGRRLQAPGHDCADIAAEVASRQSRAQLRSSSGRLLAAQEDERERISRELHDQLGQLLTAIGLDVDWALSRLPEASDPLKERLKEAGALNRRSRRRVSYARRCGRANFAEAAWLTKSDRMRPSSRDGQGSHCS